MAGPGFPILATAPGLRGCPCPGVSELRVQGRGPWKPYSPGACPSCLNGLGWGKAGRGKEGGPVP